MCWQIRSITIAALLVLCLAVPGAFAQETAQRGENTEAPSIRITSQTETPSAECKDQDAAAAVGAAPGSGGGCPEVDMSKEYQGSGSADVVMPTPPNQGFDYGKFCSILGAWNDACTMILDCTGVNGNRPCPITDCIEAIESGGEGKSASDYSSQYDERCRYNEGQPNPCPDGFYIDPETNSDDRCDPESDVSYNAHDCECDVDPVTKVRTNCKFMRNDEASYVIMAACAELCTADPSNSLCAVMQCVMNPGPACCAITPVAECCDLFDLAQEVIDCIQTPSPECCEILSNKMVNQVINNIPPSLVDTCEAIWKCTEAMVYLDKNKNKMDGTRSRWFLLGQGSDGEGAPWPLYDKNGAATGETKDFDSLQECCRAHEGFAQTCEGILCLVGEYADVADNTGSAVGQSTMDKVCPSAECCGKFPNNPFCTFCRCQESIVKNRFNKAATSCCALVDSIANFTDQFGATIPPEVVAPVQSVCKTFFECARATDYLINKGKGGDGPCIYYPNGQGCYRIVNGQSKDCGGNCNTAVKTQAEADKVVSEGNWYTDTQHVIDTLGDCCSSTGQSAGAIAQVTGNDPKPVLEGASMGCSAFNCFAHPGISCCAAFPQDMWKTLQEETGLSCATLFKCLIDPFYNSGSQTLNPVNINLNTISNYTKECCDPAVGALSNIRNKDGNKVNMAEIPACAGIECLLGSIQDALDAPNVGGVLKAPFNLRCCDAIPPTIPEAAKIGQLCSVAVACVRNPNLQCCDRVLGLFRTPPVSDWFCPGNPGGSWEDSEGCAVTKVTSLIGSCSSIVACVASAQEVATSMFGTDGKLKGNWAEILLGMDDSCCSIVNRFLNDGNLFVFERKDASGNAICQKDNKVVPCSTSGAAPMTYKAYFDTCRLKDVIRCIMRPTPSCCRTVVDFLTRSGLMLDFVIGDATAEETGGNCGETYTLDETGQPLHCPDEGVATYEKLPRDGDDNLVKKTVTFADGTVVWMIAKFDDNDDKMSFWASQSQIENAISTDQAGMLGGGNSGHGWVNNCEGRMMAPGGSLVVRWNYFGGNSSPFHDNQALMESWLVEADQNKEVYLEFGSHKRPDGRGWLLNPAYCFDPAYLPAAARAVLDPGGCTPCTVSNNTPGESFTFGSDEIIAFCEMLMQCIQSPGIECCSMFGAVDIAQEGSTGQSNELMEDWKSLSLGGEKPEMPGGLQSTCRSLIQCITEPEPGCCTRFPKVTNELMCNNPFMQGLGEGAVSMCQCAARQCVKMLECATEAPKMNMTIDTQNHKYYSDPLPPACCDVLKSFGSCCTGAGLGVACDVIKGVHNKAAGIGVCAPPFKPRVQHQSCYDPNSGYKGCECQRATGSPLLQALEGLEIEAGILNELGGTPDANIDQNGDGIIDSAQIPDNIFGSSSSGTGEGSSGSSGASSGASSSGTSSGMNVHSQCWVLGAGNNISLCAQCQYTDIGTLIGSCNPVPYVGAVVPHTSATCVPEAGVTSLQCVLGGAISLNNIPMNFFGNKICRPALSSTSSITPSEEMQQSFCLTLPATPAPATLPECFEVTPTAVKYHRQCKVVFGLLTGYDDSSLTGTNAVANYAIGCQNYTAKDWVNCHLGDTALPQNATLPKATILPSFAGKKTCLPRPGTFGMYADYESTYCLDLIGPGSTPVTVNLPQCWVMTPLANGGEKVEVYNNCAIENGVFVTGTKPSTSTCMPMNCDKTAGKFGNCAYNGSGTTQVCAPASVLEQGAEVCVPVVSANNASGAPLIGGLTGANNLCVDMPKIKTHGYCWRMTHSGDRLNECRNCVIEGETGAEKLMSYDCDGVSGKETLRMDCTTHNLTSTSAPQWNNCTIHSDGELRVTVRSSQISTNICRPKIGTGTGNADRFVANYCVRMPQIKEYDYCWYAEGSSGTAGTQLTLRRNCRIAGNNGQPGTLLDSDSVSGMKTLRVDCGSRHETNGWLNCESNMTDGDVPPYTIRTLPSLLDGTNEWPKVGIVGGNPVKFIENYWVEVSNDVRTDYCWVDRGYRSCGGSENTCNGYCYGYGECGTPDYGYACPGGCGEKSKHFYMLVPDCRAVINKNTGAVTLSYDEPNNPTGDCLHNITCARARCTVVSSTDINCGNQLNTTSFVTQQHDDLIGIWIPQNSMRGNNLCYLRDSQVESLNMSGTKTCIDIP